MDRGRFFEPVAAHAGVAYLRYSFTKGTEQEVGFLRDVLGLMPGMRVLDVGCGPGRHVHALAALGLDVVGIDISFEFLQLAGGGAGGVDGVPGRRSRKPIELASPFLSQHAAPPEVQERLGLSAGLRLMVHDLRPRLAKDPLAKAPDAQA